METNKNYQPQKPGFFMRLFWKACGADEFILRQCDYREHVKYASLGGIVVATGLMAGLAGGYAFYTIFEPKGSAIEPGVHMKTVIESIFFGLIWGAIIFNIDRFIVTSTGQGDGTEAITKEEFIGALPRIIMGLIIAITISKPLEIRIFKSEIDVELEKAQLVKQQEFIEELDSIYLPQIRSQQDKISGLIQEVEFARSRFIELEQEYINETQGDRGNGRGVGPIAEAIRNRADLAKERFDTTEKRVRPTIIEYEKNIQKIEQEYNEKRQAKETISAGLDGLLERLKLSHEIAGFWITSFITLLFVAIELTPIFFKLMLIKSPYDYLSDNYKEIAKAGAGIEIRHDYYKDNKGRQRDLVIFHEAERQKSEQQKLTDARKEIQEYIIEKWKEKEREKIDEDPYRYIDPA